MDAFFFHLNLKGIYKFLLDKLTLRSPEMFAPARIPVAEGKKMENMPKKLPSGPRQLGTKLAAKISAVENKQKKGT